MTFGSYVMTGAKIGLATGLATSSFLAGTSNRLERQDNNFAFAGFFFSGAFLIGGPFVGGTLGAGIYGTERIINSAPKSMKFMTLIFIASVALYNLGNKE